MTHHSLTMASRALLVTALACLTACSRADARHSDSSSTSSSAAGARSPTGGTPEDLTVTGSISGHLTSAKKGDAYFCGKLGPRFVASPIQGEVAGHPMDFSIMIADGFKGPGSYVSTKELTPGSGYAAVNLQLDPAGHQGTGWVSGTGANTLTVNADGRSGTVSANLHHVGKEPGMIHVSGSWRCPPDF